ncbi:MAG: hypothetical protein M0Q21_05670 [Ignavibacteriaceae bacterium]|nr:hypothetical protein [Ignavibacteriaceae bacterium]
MHLDLQSIVNYITIGIIVFFLIVVIFSVLTKKIVVKKKKREEERRQTKAPKQYYTSSKVYTFSVPDNYSVQNPLSKTFEQKTKQIERFKVINESPNRNSSSFSYRSWLS